MARQRKSRSNRQSVAGKTVADYRDLAAEWHPTKNGGLRPDEVGAGSNKRFWWVCPQGPDHEWQALVYNRTKPENPTGCPFCSGRSASDTNSLAALHPELAAEWHPSKNHGLRPDDVVPGSPKKIWWICRRGSDHEWQAALNNRTRSKNPAGCPFCASYSTSVTNSLAALHPELAAEWHPSKNLPLRPADVVAGSAEKVWWLCRQGPDHEWQATIEKRSRLGRGCPFCAGKRPSVAYSLAALHPELAAEWHPSKNLPLRPEDVTPKSGESVWWSCAKGFDHEWEARVASRTTGRGCPFCAGKRPSVAYSLAALHPKLAAEWHPSKNHGLRPEDVVPGSTQKIWWVCPQGPDHEWGATPNARTQGSGCPRCNKGWTVPAMRAFVESILPHLESLNPAERYLIFQQNGLLGSAGQGGAFARALASGRLPLEEIRKFADDETSLVDLLISDGDPAPEPQDADAADDALDSLGPAESEAETWDTERIQGELPAVQARDILGALDSHVVTTCDAEAVEFLVASANEKLWRHAYANEQETVAQVEGHRGDEYAERVRRQFLTEYGAAQDLAIPAGYSFAVAGRPTAPNLMQRLVAVRVRDENRIGNWSGTGAGKTLSAVLASRVMDAGLTVICCPNSIVGGNRETGWLQAIRSAYPDSSVEMKTWEPRWPEGARHRYLVQNYEQFQQRESEARLAEFLRREQVEFVVIDEIHFAKQRQSEDMSRRKRLVMGLVSGASEANPDLRVLGMSATPVINNLQEGKSLIELVTGTEHDDLETRATVSNAMRLHQRLVKLGSRYKPDYAATMRIDVQRRDLDCSAVLDEIRALGAGGSPLALERILTEVRLPMILEAVRRKSLIYTHYVGGITRRLHEAVSAQGWKVGHYTGDDKTGLEGFINGDVDVLIGSGAIGTGVDRLQEVCSRLIVNVLPWTHAEWEQLLGRVYRQGQYSERVEVIVPTTYATVGGKRWSYDDSKWQRLQYKKSVADAAVDGIVPEGHLRSPEQAYRDVMGWLERLESGQIEAVMRRPITVPLSDEPVSVRGRLRRYGDFSRLNQRWNSLDSKHLQERLAKNPQEWEHYHTLYREARSSWTIVPVEETIRWLQRREGRVVGDFGCGEALISAAVSDRHQVHSFDHVAINGEVTPGDMANTPLDDNSLDVAIFCLSLMGSNFTRYLREAHRTLKIDGLLHIWEAMSRFDDPKRFADDLVQLGFDMPTTEERGQFAHIIAIKSEREPDYQATLSLRAKGSD